MITLQNSGSGFFYVPIVIGEFPDLPFLETVQAVDFGDSSPELYRQAFQRLLCGLQQQPPGPDPMFQGELRLPKIDTADTTSAGTKRAHLPGGGVYPARDGASTDDPGASGYQHPDLRPCLAPPGRDPVWGGQRLPYLSPQQ